MEQRKCTILGAQSMRQLGMEPLETRRLLSTFAELPQVFSPAKDAYLDGTVAVDSDELTVRGGTPSTAYLAFRHTGLGGQTIQSARLRLPLVADATLTELDVYRGTGSLWN